MKPRLFVALAIGSILATSWYACGSKGSSSNSSPTSPSGPTNSATMFEGTIAGAGGQSGAFSVTIQVAVAASSVASLRAAGLTIKPESFTQVSGTLNVAGGASVTLAGSYDSSTNTVSLSGGGFTLTGTISGAVLSGTYTGPGSTGVFSSLNSTQASVTAYCGTHSGGSGIFTMQVSASGTVSGVAGPSAGAAGDTFAGQLNGINLSFSDPSGNTTGTGTVQNGIVNGTFSKGGTFTGTFTASTGVCSVPTPPPAASGEAFSIDIGLGGSSFTASFQNETLANGGYNFILPPGVYTISGQVQAGASLNIAFTHDPHCTGSSTTPCGGVAMSSLQSSISCAGVAGCNSPPLPASAFCTSPSGVVYQPQPNILCYPPGEGGSQTVNSCGVNYVKLHEQSTCSLFTNPPGNNPPYHCIQSPIPDTILDFQLQFTILAATTGSNLTCQ